MTAGASLLPPRRRGGCPPAPADWSALEFRPQRRVDWLSPKQLARTGVQAALSSLFGSYADRREVQAALALGKPFEDFSQRDELGIDFVSDLGDGFDATYSVAWLLARERLALREPALAPGSGGAAPVEHATRRGDILVMGGDEVYPAASRDAYRQRTKEPYRAALPWTPEERSPRLFAIPGNHDWYDGLTSFLREFCQEKWMGGWKTAQRRSYFALRLPHRWWLWGIDVQLESYVDEPQLDYFEKLATEQLQPGDRVILVSAQPSWVHVEEKGKTAFETLSYFEDRVIREKGRARLALSLSGDLHHYARYRRDSAGPDALPVERVTAGGGGAFLHSTHQLPERLVLDERDAGHHAYQLAATYPDRRESRRLAWGAFALPFRNWRFGLFLAGLYAVYSWLLQSASKWLGPSSLMDELAKLPFQPGNVGAAISRATRVLIHAPPVVALSLLIVGGLIAFCGASRVWKRLAVGVGHGLCHLLLCLSLLWSFSLLNGRFWPIDSWQQVAAFGVEMALAGGLLGGWLMAAYLATCSRLFRLHTEELFSSLSHPHRKNFLRLRIERSGELTLYPVAVPRANGDWVVNPQAADGASWIDPAGGTIDCHLIEAPIVVR